MLAALGIRNPGLRIARGSCTPRQVSAVGHLGRWLVMSSCGSIVFCGDTEGTRQHQLRSTSLALSRPADDRV
jgi:hypothetical protein